MKKDLAGSIRPGEMAVLMAILMSLVAMSIDAMLPALAQIGNTLGVVQANDTQLVISALFLGLAIGQLLYGPISDTTGRKIAIYSGLILFIVGCFISAQSWNFTMMLIGRVLQGVGGAGSRIVTVAMIRDQYEGRAMARIMSTVMTIFIVVPAIAPTMGQAILTITSWRMIFVVFIAMTTVAFVWLWLRQPETLPPEKRRAFSPQLIRNGLLETLRNRTTLGYTISAGMIFGAFTGYLISAQQIFQDLYGLGAEFPYYFGCLALAIGAASMVNSKMVMRYGMYYLTLRALLVLSGMSVVFFLVEAVLDGQVPLWGFMIWAVIGFFCMGILFGNFNAMAMRPLGHIAGTASAVIGSVTTVVSLGLGTLIGQLYNGTMLPMVGGFAMFGIISLLVMAWTENSRLRMDCRGDTPLRNL